MTAPRNPSGTRRAHFRNGKPVRATGIKGRKGRQWHGGTSRRAMRKGQWRSRRRSTVLGACWMSTGSLTTLMFLRGSYGWAALFGVLTVGFGALHAGQAVYRHSRDRRTGGAPPPAARTAPKRPPVKARARATVSAGVRDAAARKPVLVENYTADRKRKHPADEDWARASA
jgi:hypothetical protein